MLVICNCGFTRSAQPYKSTFQKRVVSCDRCVGKRNLTQKPPGKTVVVMTTVQRVHKYSGLLRIERTK